MSRLTTIILTSIFLLSCQPETNNNKVENNNQPTEIAPKWAQKAIWYQVFVERFRNGDPTNDPRKIDITGADPEYIPENWTTTDWGHDWYKDEPWFATSTGTNFYHTIQQRRYGGDLAGVLEKIDYIDSLGINAIYFNPLNDSPSLHKYDARNWRHIDRNFGPNPNGDIDLISMEIPHDPSTWVFTCADSLFLKLVEEFHKHDIKIVMDYSWNHTGTQFWAIDSLRKYGKNSQFNDWFNVKEYDNPETPENEFEYEGWAGYKFMPVVKKEIIPADDKQMPFEGNLVSESLKQQIFNISQRWLDPNGDGDPSDGVDGFRLDVAGEVPMGFWKDYRKAVKSINPDAYIVGEIWWLEWPEKLLGPQPFLKGDQFDAIMNYRWYKLARGFFAQAEPVLSPSEFVTGIENINKNISDDVLRAMMNMSSSHDAPRLSTSFFNKQLYKYQVKPLDNPNYKVHRPDEATWQEVKLFLLAQFTFLGSPQIWNGDELGMWGADDPDDRKPLIWEDISFEVERAHLIDSIHKPIDTVQIDYDLLMYYRQLARIRNENDELTLGDLAFIHQDNNKMTLGYQRTLGEQKTIVLFNRSAESQEIKIEVADENWQDLLTNKTHKTTGGQLNLTLKPVTGIVLKRLD